MNNKNRKCPMKWRNFKDPQLSFSMQRVEKGLDQRARGETYRFAERRQWSGVSFWRYCVQEIYVSVSKNYKTLLLVPWERRLSGRFSDGKMGLHPWHSYCGISQWDSLSPEYWRMKYRKFYPNESDSCISLFLKRWTISCQRGLWQRE